MTIPRLQDLWNQVAMRLDGTLACVYSERMRLFICTLLYASLLIACSGPAVSDTPPALYGETDHNPEAIARRIAALHTGAELEQIIIISVEAVEFSDSSLGCPKPDMAYLQVITPGYKVVVEVSPEPTISKTLDVRVSGKLGLVCEPQMKKPHAR